ncbi:MAG: 16S rRNA (guanine(966)-N(2))-methyltransferase RsmD [Flavobacteriales bacterium]|nr:16S rRNA (guanine(966)-N(2))-methyltransferase RsmD [Flavobacteriales bacterium]
MRIVSGKYKGLNIPLPPYGAIRPTTDRAREALFNILTHTEGIQMDRVLDLYAGSGAMSVEFASRGASSVICVEKNPRIFTSLRNFFRQKDIREITPIRDDVVHFLKMNTLAHDLVFADPPYADPTVSGLPDLVLGSQSLAEHGVFILEHESRLTLPDHPAKFDTRTYGQSVFTFYRK